PQVPAPEQDLRAGVETAWRVGAKPLDLFADLFRLVVEPPTFPVDETLHVLGRGAIGDDNLYAARTYLDALPAGLSTPAYLVGDRSGPDHDSRHQDTFT